MLWNRIRWDRHQLGGSRSASRLCRFGSGSASRPSNSDADPATDPVSYNFQPNIKLNSIPLPENFNLVNLLSIILKIMTPMTLTRKMKQRKRALLGKKLKNNFWYTKIVAESGSGSGSASKWKVGSRSASIRCRPVGVCCKGQLD